MKKALNKTAAGILAAAVIAAGSGLTRLAAETIQPENYELDRECLPKIENLIISDEPLNISKLQKGHIYKALYHTQFFGPMSTGGVNNFLINPYTNYYLILDLNVKEYLGGVYTSRTANIINLETGATDQIDCYKYNFYEAFEK
ncbi:MAG: hypothetical protein HUJ54_08080 [Erysipelotrichaceae bacterium]|nr:hypothetical protein [Erysipelotrichaceae bacterium]